MKYSQMDQPTRQYYGLMNQLYKKHKIKRSSRAVMKLINSVYSAQCNDYVMLKYNGYTLPVDVELAPMVKFLIDQGLPLGGWNYGDSDGGCFITIMNNQDHKEFPDVSSIVATLCQLFGDDNIAIYEHSYAETPMRSDKINLFLNDDWDFTTIRFHTSLVPVWNDIVNAPQVYGHVLPGCTRLVDEGMISHEELETIRMSMFCRDIDPDKIFVTKPKPNKKKPRVKRKLTLKFGEKRKVNIGKKMSTKVPKY